ncbi:MAG: N-acetylglucosamine-6-phosphate deacetylase [Verrucomicrobia bacterium]|nr:N-acetylglucosamine-6-phosphate deacetylase [Verrucomicrobiota bacterium]MBI3870308.1 N-acetylglucosamine-6-phosphate deacetylase [Verrucomicrobiota bacterium]
MSRVVIAQHILARRPVRLEWAADGPPRASWTSDNPEPSTCFAPGLVDLQVNGFSGIDFQSEQPITTEGLLHACEGLREAGCLRFLLTLITDDWDRLLERLRHLRTVRATHPALTRMVAGWHVEGPFLSDRPGFHGAHDPSLMRDPSPELIGALRRALGTDPVLLTLAPERKGAVESIGAAVALGMRVSLGHTDASSECLAAAVAAGATGFTHLGNGCPQLLDRHDNVLWRALDQPGLTIGLIPDGFHVPPTPFRVMHRAAGSDRVFYVTDAMSAAGAPPGRYPLKDQMLEVGMDQIVRRPGSAQFAGSALRPVEGVFRAAAMLGESWRQSWLRFSRSPAEWMKLPSPGTAEPPQEGCIVTTAPDGSLQSLEIFESSSTDRR